jgi:hypothetical protein
LRNDRCSGHAGRVHDTFTNLATGAIVSIGARGVFKDVTATPLRENVFEFRSWRPERSQWSAT